jgi:hypothetical protein
LGGSPINGFFDGYRIGALNHVGEKVIGENGEINGTVGYVSTEDVYIFGTRGTRTGFNINAAVAYLNAHAYPVYSKETCGNCARAVRLAIGAGGINTSSRLLSGLAKDFGPYIEERGFSFIDNANYSPLEGDVRVIQNCPTGSIFGHMDMYNGNQWVSDYFQNGFWPGKGYRDYQPSYQIYRWK